MLVKHVGLVEGYQSQGGKSAPKQVLAKLIEKTRLKAALGAVQGEIDAALAKLTSAEIAELQGLMATEIQSADAETENLRAQVAEEAKLAQNMRAMQVTIRRRAVAALGRAGRAGRGVFASAELLVGEAIERIYGP